MTNPEAQAQFHEFNQRYFGGKLPRYRVRVVDYIPKQREHGHINRKQRLICLLAGHQDACMIATLLHEMAHAATNDQHADRFMEEMKRLLSVSAPITYEADIKPYKEKERFTPKRLTRTFLRCAAEEAIMGAPTTPLRAFVRWFVLDYGYADSSAEFMRKFPWVSHVFREVKKDAKTYEKRRAQFLSKEVAAD